MYLKLHRKDCVLLKQELHTMPVLRSGKISLMTKNLIFGHLAVSSMSSSASKFPSRVKIWRPCIKK